MMNGKTKVIVFGGSGFLGSAIIRELLVNDFEVTNFDKETCKAPNLNVKFIKGDINNREEVSNAICGQEIIYHMAAIADIKEASDDPYKTIQVNVLGLVNILDAAAKHKVKKIVYGSSVYVYSKYGSFYRVSKQAGEKLLEA